MIIDLLLQTTTMGDEEVANLRAEPLNMSDLPEAGDRFEIGKLLGSGICSNVYAAFDRESG